MFGSEATKIPSITKSFHGHPYRLAAHKDQIVTNNMRLVGNLSRKEDEPGDRSRFINYFAPILLSIYMFLAKE